MTMQAIGIVYRKELIDSLRDRRTLISMIVVPVLLIPLLTIGMGVLSAKLVGQAMQEIPKVMILGGEDSPKVTAELRRLEGVQIVPASQTMPRKFPIRNCARPWRSPVALKKSWPAANP